MAVDFADPMLLDKIDKLFACGVGDYIDLPQLVVVGNQSSGKSSVLERLTGLPFPRDSGLCTRFATQITFRRAQSPSVSASIIPAKDTSPDRAAALRGWLKTNMTALNAENFATIMHEVYDVMGISTEQASGSHGTFSEDVLKLEICGPEQEHFSVVDVPGIFKKTTEGLTTKEDMILVDRMVRRYMENPRSILLTVIPANVDIATQEILTMAEEVDTDGLRTLGVLTKPDLVDKGTETSVIDLIEGKRHKLTLGWCLVKNPSQQQLNSGVNPDQIEKDFFRGTQPWSTLDAERVGVGSLRVRLREILASSIRREFPKVKSEITKKLATSKQALASLGPQREKPRDQRQYLSNISIRFQEITAGALRADYGASDWYDEHPNLKFATAVVTRNELLNFILESHGGSYEFIVPDDNSIKFDELSISTSKGEEQDEKSIISLRTTEDHEDLDEDLFCHEHILEKKKATIMNWLKNVYETSRGFELGTFDSSLLATAMKQQSSKWEAIALTYISDIISLAHAFIVKLLHLICPHEARVRDGILAALSDKLESKYQKAVEQVQLLLSIERHGTPATMNHYFNENLEKSRQARMRAIAEQKAPPDSSNSQVIRLDELAQHYSMSNTEHVVRELHDILHSYYKVARKRFVDNLCMQAADYCLVTGPKTPLKMFDPSFVNGLSDEQLEEIAGETSSAKGKRKALRAEIAKLQTGKKILV